LRIVKVFWGLDANLAYRRHFPAINWLNSYSLYQTQLASWFNENVNARYTDLANRAMGILQEEEELNEMVRLVGYDALSERDQLKLEVAKSVREDYLQQDSFNDLDSYTSSKKQSALLDLVLHFSHEATRALDGGVYLKKVLALPIREDIAKAKTIPEGEISRMDLIKTALEESVTSLIREEATADA